MRDYLAVGPQKLLGRMFNRCLGEKYGYLPGNYEMTEVEASRGPKEAKGAEGRGKGAEGRGKGAEGKGKGVGGKKSKVVAQEAAAAPVPVAHGLTVLHALDSCEVFDTTVLLERVQPR